MNNLLVSISSTSSTDLIELKQQKYLCLEGMHVARDTNAYVFNENIFLGLVGFGILYFASHPVSLNSDSQQFHQYQQNEQSSLNSDGQQFHDYQENEQ